MQKIVFVIILFAASGSLRCGQTGLTGNQDTANIQPTLTTNPTPIDARKGRPSKEYLEHYDKGIDISTDSNIPDNLTKAIEEFKKAAEIDPKDTTAYWRMVELYDRLKDYNEEENYLRKIMERNPQDLEAQWWLARLLVWDSNKYMMKV